MYESTIFLIDHGSFFFRMLLDSVKNHSSNVPDSLRENLREQKLQRPSVSRA